MGLGTLLQAIYTLLRLSLSCWGKPLVTCSMIGSLGDMLNDITVSSSPKCGSGQTISAVF